MESGNDQVSQAVVFAECHDSNFGPLTFSQPKIWMPLVNRPVFDYTLDMLARSNIGETFIFCSQNSDKLRSFVKQYQMRQFSKMNIQIFVSDEYTTLGAVIRDLDAKGIIKSDFVLIHGDCVGNLKLDELLRVHKQNIQKDPGCVMTCVFRKLSPQHRTRTIENNCIVLLDSNQKIVFFEKKFGKIVDVPMRSFASKISIHNDLLDTNISICSNKVPLDFSDNFDFDDREDFIDGLLADEDDLLQHYIYAHIMDDGYACRVSSINAYDSISKDIIQRFAFPIVPDMESDCCYRRYNVYIQDNVNTNNSKIVKNVAIGGESTIKQCSVISDSIIGSKCQIGKNVIIKDSYIWNNVIIEDDCTIEKCIIASNVVIKRNSKISSNCILSNDVVIDENVTLSPSTYVINDQDIETDINLVGPNGVGSLFKDDFDDCDGEIKQIIEDDSSSVSTSFSDSSDDRCYSPVDEFKGFYNEVYDSLQRGIEEKLLAENIILEINSSKHAYNVPMNEVNSLVIKAILKLAQKDDKDFLTLVKYQLKHLLPLVQNYIRSVESQNDCIYALEEFYLSNENILTSLIFTKIIQYLYDENILDEDVILSWYFKPKILEDHETIEQKKLRSEKEITLFVKWLNEAEEESSDDED